jgi:glycosyltransferase involved in cell wall biosynthesis
LEKKKGGIVNAQDVVATMAAKRANYKVILTVHGDITREFHALGMLNAGAYQWFLNYEMAAYQNADWIVCVDTRLKNHVIQLHQESYKKITVIHNFIDVMEFRKNVEKERERKKLLKEKLGFPDDAFVVLLTRRFVPKNGVIYALKALDELINKRRHTKYFLILAGKGEEGGLLKHFVKSNHLENYVYFCGPIPNQEIPIYYAIADVNVVPSVNIGGYIEATSISAIEGLSSGIPTVASGIGGLKEMIIDNWNGLLFEEKNHFQLADILEGLRKNYSTLQEKLSTNAYTHAIKNHHYMNASKQFEYIYENFMP